jgi:predicted ATPase/DNA-binding CsgD family transcriptional regulator
MLTLTGAGGCGKTRLSLQLAAELLEEYPDGVWWADLAPVGDPQLVASVVAALGSVQEVHGERPVNTLVGELRHRRLLLVFDNCEHLVLACAELVSGLLRGCPSVSALATSREPLGVVGEVALRVPSLPFPEIGQSVDGLAEFDAVRLFVDRARRVRPNFRLTRENTPAVAEICRRLDGIPLAIELAAARTRVLSPGQIAAGLADRFRLLTGGARTALPRQRTLEASVDWSYGLLSDPERALLARLSVFAGGFGLDAAEEVASRDGIDRYQVLDLLSGLVDRSLVQVEEGEGDARYRLLETVRVYARQRLIERGEAEALSTRHLDFYVTLAERAEAELEGPGFGEWLFRLGGELDNLRAAMDWAAASGEAEKGLRLVGATTIMWWLTRMHFGEAERRFEVALAAAEGVDPAVHARALVSSIAVQWSLDFRRARELAEQAVALAREAGDSKLLAVTLYMRAYTEFLLGVGVPRPEIEEGLRLAREVDDRPQVLWCLMTLGMLEGLTGAPSAGRRCLQDALALSQRWGRVREYAWALGYLGLFVELPAGELGQAEALQAQGLAAARAIADRVAIAMALGGLSHVAVVRGEFGQAQALADEALTAARDAGARVPEGQALLSCGVAAFARGDAPAAQSALERALEVSEAVGVKLLVAHSRAFLAGLAVYGGDVASAREHIDRGLAAADGLPWPLTVVLLARSRLARLEGDDGGAEDMAHELLRVAAASENRVAIADALEALAGLAARQESFQEAARLYGAAERVREEIGYIRLPVEQPGWEADAAAVRAGLGQEEHAAAWEEGRTLSAERAIAYARRGRGERRRPSAGWGSLTPAELEVVRLAAQGLSNPEIAGRLFVTRNTVKAHLGHVCTKLDVTSRAELAAEATRRGI